MKVSLIAYTALSAAAAATSGWYALSQTEEEWEGWGEKGGIQELNNHPIFIGDVWDELDIEQAHHPLREAGTFSTLQAFVEQSDTEDGTLATLLSSHLFLLVNFLFLLSLPLYLFLIPSLLLSFSLFVDSSVW